jgi:hypothetical protein
MKYNLKFFVVGEKGGVGKTWFTFILIEFLRQFFNRLPTIVDMDTSTPNIAKTYLQKIYTQWSKSSLTKTSTSGVFEAQVESDSEPEDVSRIEQLLQDQISLTNDREGLMGDKLLEILDISDETVVAMPSQSQQGLCEWLDRYLKQDDDEQAQDKCIVFWWVSDGSFESLQLFDRFIYQYPPSELIQYCLVINKGSRDIDWARYKLTDIYPDIFQLVAAGEIKAIEIEKIGFEPMILRQVQEQGLSFTDILNNNPKNNRYFLSRFNKWLQECYAQIRLTEYIPAASKVEELFHPADNDSGDRHCAESQSTGVERHAA